MRFAVLVLVLAGAAVAAAGESGESKSLKPFQGKWRIEKASERGKAADAAKMKKFPVTFAGDKMEMIFEGARTVKWTVSVRPDRKPAEIDVVLPGKGGKGPVMRGIYQFEKDTLTIAFGLDEGSTRPEKFESVGGKKPTLVMVLKKAK